MSVQVGSLPLILLVGGRSSRMGTAKGLLPFRGKPWLTEQLDRFSAVGGRRAVVVLGYRQREYLEALGWLDDARQKPVLYNGVAVSAAVNPIPEFGPFSTIQCGARRLLAEKGVPGAYVLPIDVPCPSAPVWRELAAGMTGPIAACLPRCGARGGHPVLLSADFMSTLVAQSTDSESARLDCQIGRLGPERVRRVMVDDPRISLNLNTPERWQTFVGGTGQG